MSATQLHFAPIAEEDLDEITQFIAQDNPARALLFVRELREHCARIADQPDAYPLREEYGADIRIAVHGRYLIFHRRRERTLVIERIVHGARHREGLQV